MNHACIPPDVEALCRRFLAEFPEHDRTDLPFFIRKVMIESRGTANPVIVTETLKRLLDV